MPKREQRKSVILNNLVEEISNRIKQMSDGSEASIRWLVNDVLSDRGYGTKHFGMNLGYSWTKDNGATYAVCESDLFEVLDLTVHALKGTYELDFSKYEDQIVGLPYNLQFTVKKVGEKR